MPLSVGIGLTNDCNLQCAHCYRPTDRIHALTMDQIRIVCDSLPVGSVGLGTGENALHPGFLAVLDLLWDRGIRVTMASNGYSLNTMPADYLRRFHDVEVSIDYPTQTEQDAFRGAGNWDDVHRAMARCSELGVHVSVLATMMNTNYTRMGELVELARSRGASLRVNAYQPVRSGGFTMSYEQFWDGYRRLLGAGLLVSCTEPVVRAAIGLGEARSPCGHQSVRVTPTGAIAPCVYWPGSTLTIDDLPDLGQGVFQSAEFRQATAIPPSAADCLCLGGCASRRALLGELDAHDLYCPWVRGDRIDIDYELAPERELLRAKNYCTTIVA